MKRTVLSTATVATALVLLSHITPAQQTTAGQQTLPTGAPAPQPGPPRGRGPGGGPPPAADDTTGFVSLFDGLSLKGWDGDPMFWRVENGVIVAESTPEKVVTDNTFLIWRGGRLKNSELKADARFAGTAGNSGIQVRSRPLTAATARSGGQPRPWGIGGYQVDMVPAGGTGTAPWYEEAGRGFLAEQGRITRITRSADGTGDRKLIGALGENNPAANRQAGGSTK